MMMPTCVHQLAIYENPQLCMRSSGIRAYRKGHRDIKQILPMRT
jgi:hypothetical protein